MKGFTSSARFLAEAGVTFSQIGPVELKGISGIVALHAVHRP
jgi:hypothetical protein